MQFIQSGIKVSFSFLKKYKWLCFSVLFFIAAVLAVWSLIGGNLGYDWRLVFRPAALKLLSGEDPYSTNQFILAPWSLLLFVPLSLLPENLGMAILTVLGIGVYAYAAIKLKAKPIGVIAILLSPMVLHDLITGNIDWLAILGFVLPQQIGLFFLLLKPQIGIVLIVYWGYIAIIEKHFIRTFAPVILVTLLSFLLFGLWPFRISSVDQVYNASLWPASIPFGLVLIAMAFRKKNVRIAYAASPLISPHVMFHSWATILFALAPDTLELMIATLSSWGLILVFGFKL